MDAHARCECGLSVSLLRGVVEALADGVSGANLKWCCIKTFLRKKVRTVLTYCDTKTIVPAAGAAHHTFCLNDLNDPDVTGVGHQPAYHDQWSNHYGKYRVLSASWKITFRTHRATHFDTYLGTDTVLRPYVDTLAAEQQRTNNIVCWEVNNADAVRQTQTADKNFLRETGGSQPGVRWKYLPPSGCTLTGSSTIKGILNDPESVDDSHTFGATPTHRAFLLVGALSKDGSYASDVRFDITIKYTCILSDPSDVGES